MSSFEAGGWTVWWLWRATEGKAGERERERGRGRCGCVGKAEGSLGDERTSGCPCCYEIMSVLVL